MSGEEGIAGLRSEISLHEMESGRGAMKMWGAGGAGVKSGGNGSSKEVVCEEVRGAGPARGENLNRVIRLPGK